MVLSRMQPGSAVEKESPSSTLGDLMKDQFKSKSNDENAMYWGRCYVIGFAHLQAKKHLVLFIHHLLMQQCVSVLMN